MRQPNAGKSLGSRGPAQGPKGPRNVSNYGLRSAPLRTAEADQLAAARTVARLGVTEPIRANPHVTHLSVR